jgi:ABC-type glycerol-3-phosphate transport system substrate-binding protein
MSAALIALSGGVATAAPTAERGQDATAGASVPAPGGGQPITLTQWYYNFPPFVAFQQQKIKDFEAKYPNVTVNYDSSTPPVGDGGYEQKITSSLATGTAPDIFSVFGPQAPQLIARNQLSPIDDTALKALGYDSIDALKASRAPGAFDGWTDASGNVYGVPDALSYLNMYCNTDHLKAAGIDPATVSFATWDDFINFGKQVIAANPSFYQDASGKFTKNFFKAPMYADDGWGNQVLELFLAQAGASVLSPDGTTAAINSPEAIQAVTALMNASRELGDPNVGPSVPGDIFAGFGAGDQTCVLSGEFLYGAFLKPTNSPLIGHYQAYPLPQINPDKPGNVFWGWAFTVNQASQNKDAAWLDIAQMESDPNGLVDQVGIWPPVPDLASLPAVQNTPFGTVIAANRNGAQNVFHSLKYPQISSLLRGLLENMAYQGTDVTTTLNSAADQINGVLAGS